MKPSDSRQLQNNQQWLEQYRELQEYARDNKRTDPPFGHPLYWWTVAQCKKRNEGRLPPHHRKLLDAIQFCWRMNPRGKINGRSRDRRQTLFYLFDDDEDDEKEIQKPKETLKLKKHKETSKEKPKSKAKHKPALKRKDTPKEKPNSALNVRQKANSAEFATSLKLKLALKDIAEDEGPSRLERWKIAKVAVFSGFDGKRCQLALKMNGWEEEKAIEWIFNPNNFAHLNQMTREFDAKGRAAKKSKKKKSASTKDVHKSKQLKTGGKWNGTQNGAHKRKHPSNERTKNHPKRRMVIEIQISSEEEGDEEENEEEGEAETAEGKEEEDAEDKGEISSEEEGDEEEEEEGDEEEDEEAEETGTSEKAFSEEKADLLLLGTSEEEEEGHSREEASDDAEQGNEDQQRHSKTRKGQNGNERQQDRPLSPTLMEKGEEPLSYAEETARPTSRYSRGSKRKKKANGTVSNNKASKKGYVVYLE